MRLALRAAIAALAVASGLCGWLALDIWTIGGSSDPRPADAALVLGAAVFDDRPSPVFAERLRHAATLFRAGRVPLIIVSGGLAEGDTLTEAEAGRRWLREAGVPDGAIVLEPEARTTFENLRFATPILQAMEARTVLIVTDPLHMRRGLAMARDFGLDARPAPTPTTRYRTLDRQLPMLAREVWFNLGYMLLRQ